MSTWAKIPAQRRLYRAFLSHAHTDKSFVDELHNWLSLQAKILVWYDTYALFASATISTELATAISQCRSMIIILSKASIKSGWVEEEYSAAIGQRAKYKQYRIIPIRIEECEIPGFLQTTKWIDALDKKIDSKVAFELLTALYYDNQALALENVFDLYISRSWRPAEASLPDHVCQLLDKAGYRLIGDSEDQLRYNPDRVQSIIKSCGGLISIIPNRGNNSPSKYVIDEIEFAQKAGLPSLIIAETGIDLPEDIGRSTISLSIDDIEKTDVNIILQNKIEALYDQWQKPSQPYYTFLATDLENTQRNQIAKQAIQHITAMPCIVGEKIPESHIRELIAKQITKASLVIADISDNNINTSIEAGIAIGADRPLRLIAHTPRGNVPFMLSNYEVFSYKDDTEMLAAIHRISFPLRRRVINSELPR